MREIIKIGDIQIEVRFKPIKNLHLSVHPPNGEVRISSPEFYDVDKIRTYAATKLAWIKKEQKKFLAQEREFPRKYLTQESHYFFGERFLLKLEKSTKNKVSIQGKKLLIQSRFPEDKKLSHHLLYQFYRRELRRILKEMLVRNAHAMDLEIPDFKIRKMKTKWGSCNSEKNLLWFNIELAKKPMDCVEYIVVHELVHLIERHHNKRFVILLDKFFPNWQAQKQILNELPLGAEEFLYQNS